MFARLLSRFSFSLIILTVVFAWEGNRIRRGEEGPGNEKKMYAFFAAAVGCAVLGAIAMRERHRRMPYNDDDRS